MTSRVIVGIDPGLSGAVAVYWHDRHITVEDTPTITIKKNKGSKQEYLPSGMVDLLSDLDPEQTHVFIEAVHSMPKQGVVSTFTFGKGFGIWLGIIAALKLPVTHVTPQRWKKELMDGMPDKDAGRIRAQQLYPSLMPMLKRKLDIGRADALLIMEYGRRSLK